MHLSFLMILVFALWFLPVVASGVKIDSDRDGVEDSLDNCPDYWNPDQYDADGDGIGNVCDECTDQDGDGFGDPGFPSNTCPEDNCPGFYNPDQTDSDGDGIGDLCEGILCGDYDGDGDNEAVADLVRMSRYLLGYGISPACMSAANSGACRGVNFHDLAYTWSMIAAPIVLNCDGPEDCDCRKAGEILLDHVDGLYAKDTVFTGSVIKFYLRFTGDSAISFSGLANGFRVYSPTGSEWTETSVEELVNFWRLNDPWCTFDLLQQKRLIGMTGSGADTIAIAYIEYMCENSLRAGFDSVTHAIAVGPIPHEYSGGEICLDSCWYPPGGDWLWAVDPHFYGETPFIPSWDGPHCFTIYNCCHIRGDINNDTAGPDIADLVCLVSYMFQGGPDLPCPEAADINDSGGGPDIADLVYLVSFMFQDGPAPEPCP